jgi:hypothetical protein
MNSNEASDTNITSNADTVKLPPNIHGSGRLGIIDLKELSISEKNVKLNYLNLDEMLKIISNAISNTTEQPQDNTNLPTVSPLTVSEMIYRQSLINDIKRCPRSASHRWKTLRSKTLDEYGEPRESSMAALLGTAGHKVIEIIHKDRRFDIQYIDLLNLFIDSFNDELLMCRIEPNPSSGFETIEEELDSKSVTYTEYIEGYIEYHNKMKNNIIVTGFEQQFSMLIKYNSKIYVFSGTIDQIGTYQDGTFSIRDMKFRDNAFKPNYYELSFEPQFTIYASAMLFGYPACKECSPRYTERMNEEKNYSVETIISYSGPCEECKKKMKTPKFPYIKPNLVELIWMKDFEKYQKSTRGKNKGDFKGDCIYKNTVPIKSYIKILHELITLCELFENGLKIRSPGEHCMMFCDFKSNCINEIING